MAPVRVRGCAERGVPSDEGAPGRQADASRRRNGPRKATFRRPITVRLRGKSCPFGGPDVLRTREKSSSGARVPRDSQQADVGTKTRSDGRVASSSRGARRETCPRRGADALHARTARFRPVASTARRLFPRASPLPGERGRESSIHAGQPPVPGPSSRCDASRPASPNAGPTASDDRRACGYTPTNVSHRHCGGRRRTRRRARRSQRTGRTPHSWPSRRAVTR